MSLLDPRGNAIPSLSTPVPGPSTDEPQAPTRVTTAFLVYQMPNGQWTASEDISAAIVPARKPLPDDIIAGAANVQAQTIGRKTADMSAQAVVGTQMALARQMQSRQVAPDEAAVLADLARH